MSSSPIRQQLLVEQDVQVSLIIRAVLYGGACMTYFTVIQFFTQSMNHPDVSVSEILFSLIDEAIYWVPGFFVLGPLMVYDMLRITNRVAGPIFSLRREMQAINAGENGRGLRFRNDDYLDTLATEFNVMRNQILDLREQNAQMQAGAAEPDAGNRDVADADRDTSNALNTIDEQVDLAEEEVVVAG